MASTAETLEVWIGSQPADWWGVDHVSCLASLPQPTFGELFNQPVGGVSWPESLQGYRLVINTLDKSIDKDRGRFRWIG